MDLLLIQHYHVSFFGIWSVSVHVSIGLRPQELEPEEATEAGECQCQHSFKPIVKK